MMTLQGKKALYKRIKAQIKWIGPNLIWIEMRLSKNRDRKRTKKEQKEMNWTKITLLKNVMLNKSLEIKMCLDFDVSSHNIVSWHTSKSCWFSKCTRKILIALSSPPTSACSSPEPWLSWLLPYLWTLVHKCRFLLMIKVRIKLLWTQ